MTLPLQLSRRDSGQPKQVRHHPQHTILLLSPRSLRTQILWCALFLPLFPLELLRLSPCALSYHALCTSGFEDIILFKETQTSSQEIVWQQGHDTVYYRGNVEVHRTHTPHVSFFAFQTIKVKSEQYFSPFCVLDGLQW